MEMSMRDSKYFPNFAQLSSMLRIKPESLDSKRKIAISADLLKELIVRCLAHLEFDEHWYVSKYPDVKEAWEKGQIKDLREHFLTSGYFEGRFPNELAVDEKWYLDKYEDVRDAIASGKAASAAQHYFKNGQFEGRSPTAALESAVKSWAQLANKF
jgi:hypothetical protein